MGEKENILKEKVSTNLVEGDKLKGERSKGYHEMKRAQVIDVQNKLIKNGNIQALEINFGLFSFLVKKIFQNENKHLMRHVLLGSQPSYNNSKIEYDWDEKDIIAEEMVILLGKIAEHMISSDETERYKFTSIMKIILEAIYNNDGKMDVPEIEDKKVNELLDEWNNLMKRAEECVFSDNEATAKAKNQAELERLIGQQK